VSANYFTCWQLRPTGLFQYRIDFSLFGRLVRLNGWVTGLRKVSPTQDNASTGVRTGAQRSTFLLWIKFEPMSWLFEQPKAVCASFRTARATCTSELPFLSLGYSFSKLFVTKYSSFDKESIHISDYDRVLTSLVPKITKYRRTLTLTHT